MKKCNYCGGENEDGAVQCRKCGLGLDEPYREILPAGKNPTRQNGLRLGLRLLAALGLGAAVASISLCVSWRETFGSMDAAHPQQRLTQYYLRSIKRDISIYETTFGSAPKSSTDLLKLTTAYLNADSDTAGPPLDGWHRPFLFTNTGAALIALSYGRDGKPGGQGLDFDLTTTNIFDAQARRPTFGQFLHDMPTAGMINSCFACAALTFLLACFTIKLPEINRQSLLGLAFQLLATLIAASFVASIIAGLHIPSGH
jgi:hypothetical protein